MSGVVVDVEVQRRTRLGDPCVSRVQRRTHHRTRNKGIRKLIRFEWIRKVVKRIEGKYANRNKRRVTEPTTTIIRVRIRAAIGRIRNNAQYRAIGAHTGSSASCLIRQNKSSAFRCRKIWTHLYVKFNNNAFTRRQQTARQVKDILRRIRNKTSVEARIDRGTTCSKCGWRNDGDRVRRELRTHIVDQR